MLLFLFIGICKLWMLYMHPSYSDIFTCKGEVPSVRVHLSACFDKSHVAKRVGNNQPPRCSNSLLNDVGCFRTYLEIRT